MTSSPEGEGGTDIRCFVTKSVMLRVQTYANLHRCLSCIAFTYRTCCWAGACECHHVIHSYFNIWSIRTRPLYWRKYSSSGLTATRWNLLYYKPGRNTLDCHWLRHKSHCWKGWNIQQSRLLWRSDSKCRRPHFGWTSNFWQPDVFWGHPARAFCWTCHWWTAHNRLRSKAPVKSLLLINIPGQETSGRYVIVQMDNGGDPLNLQEVKAFGRATGTLKIAKLGNFWGMKNGISCLQNENMRPFL